MNKSCWSCGHFAFACFVNGKYEIIKDVDYVCNKWVKEGTKGTVTEIIENHEEADGSSWEENEHLKDDESNL